VKFLLATTDPQKLPITILSRCLQFHLKSLDQTQIARQLEWVLDQEGQPFEPRALLALAKAADGSMRDALSLTDQALAHGNGSVRESVLTMLGTLDHHHLHQLLEAVLRQDAPATMAKITEIATLGRISISFTPSWKPCSTGWPWRNCSLRACRSRGRMPMPAAACRSHEPGRGAALLSNRAGGARICPGPLTGAPHWR
jgi:hypothetical protein